MLNCFTTQSQDVIPLVLTTPSTYESWLAQQSKTTQQWLNTSKFRPDVGATRFIPTAEAGVSFVVCCVAEQPSLWRVGHLPLALPAGTYSLDIEDPLYESYALGWGLGAYQFTRYKKAQRLPAQLVLANPKQIADMVESIYLVRDLINTPTEDMGPSELAQVAKNLAAEFNADFTEIVGDDLLKQNYPCIHAVGRACDDAPRLLDIRFGNINHPKVTLVGKGVCFDSGGLDIKPFSAMLLMKKDMGGAANVLGLARMIMACALPIRLRVLIPAVENSISGNAYRPGDVIKSRKGLTIEIGNTDAEGRLVLADALTEAATENPELLIDMSTLTGAARIALGTELPAVFSNNDDYANAIIKQGEKEDDFTWRMPLFAPYRESINSPIADLSNNGTDSYGGAITAALFLKEFVPDNIPWLHYDLMAWNLKARPGRPQGGEAMGVRGLFSYLQARFQ
ncbi:MAG: leucyl aminopeptidase family protein [Gammaproteobacteria bacterium]